jgi:subtilase family serine protease
MGGAALPPDQVGQAPATDQGAGTSTQPEASEAPDGAESSDEEAPESGGSPKAGNMPAAPASGARGLAAAPVQPLASGQRFVCPKPAAAGHMSCDAVVRTDLGGGAPNGYHGTDIRRAFTTTLASSNVCSGNGPYCAKNLQQAYGLLEAAKKRGTGITVAIVDAYGYTTAAPDLATYRKTMGLRACTTANGCLRILNQQGQTKPLPTPGPPSDDWRSEEALDLDMVSAICPNCKIVLVQANSDFANDLAVAVDKAANLGAVSVNNSYSGAEYNKREGSYDHPGHAMVASSGDTGTGPQQPCSYASVLCVGGTTLVKASNTRGWSETAWSEGGSGCSRLVSKPQWQTDKGCTMRSEVDASADADPSTGVAVYDTTGSSGSGWLIMGGTSASSPIIAGVIALANDTANTVAPEWVWQHGKSSAFHDVTKGSNGSCTITYICNARPGYDGPTGWGTPNGIAGF